MSKWGVILLLMLLSLYSCSRREQGGSGSNDKPSRAAGTDAGVERTSPEVKSRKEIALTRKEKPESAERAYEKGEDEYRFLPHIETGRVLPDDFKIGELQDILAYERVEREQVKVVRRLLETLIQGRIDKESLLAGKREMIEKTLSYYLEQGILPESFRLGRMMQDSEDAAHLNVRLFGDVGVAAGEIYLSREQGRWYVSDLQIGFGQLNQPYEHEEEKFFPSSYGWSMS